MFSRSPLRHCLLLVALALQAGCSRSGSSSSPEDPRPLHPRHLIQQLPPILQEDAGDVECRFDIVNDTDRTVRILRVTHSCSCSSTSLGQNELAPGGRTQLILSANLRGRVGKQRLTCSAIADSGRPWECEALVTIYQRRWLDPSILSFGEVKDASPQMRTVMFHETIPKGEAFPDIV